MARKRKQAPTKETPRYLDPKERNRFYLLPGQGGRAYHRKQMFILKTALLIGLFVSGLFALVVWLMNRGPK